MADAIARGNPLALFGDGAPGAGSVDSGRLNLFFGSHASLSGRRVTLRSGSVDEDFGQVVETGGTSSSRFLEIAREPVSSGRVGSDFS